MDLVSVMPCAAELRCGLPDSGPVATGRCPGFGSAARMARLVAYAIVPWFFRNLSAVRRDFKGIPIPMGRSCW